MSLTQSFSTMLKNYRPTNILKDEVKKRDYMFRTVKKDQKWKGGRYQIPVHTAVASSVKFGALTASDDIAETEATLAYETNYREIFHSLIFNLRDLDSGDNYEGSFIKVMMDTIEPAARFFKEVISHNLLLGSKIDTLTSNGTALGVAAVTFPERFERDQKVILRNNDPAAAAYYVIAIDVESKTVTLSASRGGSAADISAFTTAKASAIYYDGSVNTSTGALQNGMNNMRSALLSSSNGGDASLHNLTKASYKQWQAHNQDLSGATSETLLEELFKAWVMTSRIGRGMPTEILLSFDNYHHIVNSLETNTRFRVSDMKADHGFSSVKITGPDGALRITALREMDNDIAPIVDWNSMRLAGMRFFEPVKSPKSGDPVYEVRAASGYQYIMDVKFYGNLIFYHPSYNGIGHSISIS